MTCLVVMYHYVRDTAATRFPDIRALAPELFAQQLDWLQEHYTVVDVARLESALNGGCELPPDAALLTFDDGFIDHYEVVFPLLRERGFGGAFFLSQDACGESPRMLGVHKSQFLLAHLGAEAFGRAVLAECKGVQQIPESGRTVFGIDRWEESDDRAIKHLINYELPFEEAERVLELLFVRHIGESRAFARRLHLNTAMIHEMAGSGMTFGYHTRTHRMLSRLPVAQQEHELGTGVEWLRGLTGQTTVPFCYPWGGIQTYTRDTVRILDKVGYSLAFNTVRRRLTVGVDGRHELPRFDTRDLPPYTRGEEDGAAAAAAIDEA